jgi:hypothetical protein
MCTNEPEPTNKWVGFKESTFYDENGAACTTRILSSILRIPMLTRIDTFKGEVITMTEYTTKVMEINTNTNGAKLGTEYGIELKTKKGVDKKHLVIFPTDCKTGEIAEAYTNTPSLYANEPSKKRNTPGGPLFDTVANSVIVANYDTDEMELVALENIEVGSEVLVYYGKIYTRKGYKTNCRSPAFWMYRHLDNLVQMPIKQCKTDKPVVVQCGKEHMLTFSWVKNKKEWMQTAWNIN